jgi:hypothetical protein
MKVFLSWSGEASQEAGALAHLPHLAPFLFRLERGALNDSPLMRFQLTEFSADGNRSKGEFYKLIEGVNSELVEEERPASELSEKNVDHWWSELKSDLDAIPDSTTPPSVFFLIVAESTLNVRYKYQN